MEAVTTHRLRPTYYFSFSDEEILDDKTLCLSSDEDTWLYKSEATSISEQYFELGSPYQDQRSLSTSDSVDSRTFTRRKHCSLRPSLDTVVESPLSNNRSSLGLLNASKLLNDTMTMGFTPKLRLENLEKTSLDFTVFDKKIIPQRVYKLDSGFRNSVVPGVESISVDNQSLEKVQSYSEPSVTPTLHLPKHNSFSEKLDINCCPPIAFQDESCMMDSLISIPDNHEVHSVLSLHGEQMTDSLVNFLIPGSCKPPKGFEDNVMVDSVMKFDKNSKPPGDMMNSLDSLIVIDEGDVRSMSNMTNSMIDYLENVKLNPPASLIESTASSESENIPPNHWDNEDHKGLNDTYCNDRLKASGDGKVKELDKLNSTYDLEKNEDVILNPSNKHDDMTNIMLTNNANIARQRKDSGDVKDELNVTRTLETTYEIQLGEANENDGKNFKTRALNNRDLNVTRDINTEEIKDFNTTITLSKELTPDKIISASPLNSPKRNEILGESNQILNPSKQIPSRNSPFNTTFTKLQSETQSNNYLSMKLQSRSPRSLNTTFTKSLEGLCPEGLEDDQSSSASDSSFSSGSTKPRSVDELRTIARQQESSLAQQTSTPTESAVATSGMAKLDLTLSPIRTPDYADRNNISRSANCSPVRNHQGRLPNPRPISRLQQPTFDPRYQSQISSNVTRTLEGQMIPISNVTRTITQSRLRPVSRLAAPQVSLSGREGCSRPSTAPATTAIPRPSHHQSRLPMPRARVSGIPSLKRGGRH